MTFSVFTASTPEWSPREAASILAISRDTPEIAQVARDAGLEFSGPGGYPRCDDLAYLKAASTPL